MGKVLKHHYADSNPSDTAKFALADQLYLDVSKLARKLEEDAEGMHYNLSLTAPLSLTYSVSDFSPKFPLIRSFSESRKDGFLNFLYA
jgi:hypothetical protein